MNSCEIVRKLTDEDPEDDLKNDPVLALHDANRAELVATLRRINAVERAQEKLARAVAAVGRKADAAHDAITNGEFLFAVPWLKSQGVHVPDAYNGVVGGEIAAIAIELGDDPHSRKKRPNRGYLSHTYSPLIMEEIGMKWIKRNRPRHDRRGWFRNVR